MSLHRFINSGFRVTPSFVFFVMFCSSLFVLLPLFLWLLYCLSFFEYVVKFVSDLRQVGGYLWVPPPIKLTATI